MSAGESTPRTFGDLSDDELRRIAVDVDANPGGAATARAVLAKRRADPVAASVHRRLAGMHYDAAERLRKLGLLSAADAALRAARDDDEIAEMLEAGRERGRRGAQS